MRTAKRKRGQRPWGSYWSVPATVGATVMKNSNTALLEATSQKTTQNHLAPARFTPPSCVLAKTIIEFHKSVISRSVSNAHLSLTVTIPRPLSQPEITRELSRSAADHWRSPLVRLDEHASGVSRLTRLLRPRAPRADLPQPPRFDADPLFPGKHRDTHLARRRADV